MSPSEQYDAVCRERFDEIASKLDSIDRAIRGHNGTPGMVTRLAIVEDCIRRDQDEGRSDKDRFWKAFGVIIALVAVVVSVISYVKP